jgi:quercetin 2,3-dioxygenase
MADTYQQSKLQQVPVRDRPVSAGRRSVPVSTPATLCRVALRPYAERGETQAPGVTGHHHFCFAGFQRPDRMSWGALRMLSHYDIAPWAERPASFLAGFEVVTIVLAGRWKRTGDLPAATAFGANAAELVSTGVGASLGGSVSGGAEASLIEIWVASQKPLRLPRRQSVLRRRTDLVRPIATGAPAESDALCWDSVAQLHYGWLEPGDHFRTRLEYAELGFLLVVDGVVTANATMAQAGDGVAASGPGNLQVSAIERARVVWLRGL